jgi:hypothetical protein
MLQAIAVHTLDCIYAIYSNTAPEKPTFELDGVPVLAGPGPVPKTVELRIPRLESGRRYVLQEVGGRSVGFIAPRCRECNNRPED